MIGIDVKNYALFNSGIYQATFPLVEALIKELETETFLAMGPEAGCKKFSHLKNVQKQAISIPKFPKYREYLYNFTSFPLVARKSKLKLFYSPYFDLFIPKKYKSIITIHDMVHFHHPELYRSSLRKYLIYILKRNAKNADHIITVSEYTRQDIIKLLGISPNKVTVVNNSIDEALLLPIKKSGFFEVLKKEPLLKDKKRILYSGGVEHRKNLSRLFKAFRSLSKDYVLIATGEEEKYSAYRKDIAELVERNQIYFTGFLEKDDFRQLYHHVDLIVYPSLWEGFGYPIIEAMAARKPLACSNVSCMPSVGGEYPIYFDPFSCDEIKKAIEKGAEMKISDSFVFPEKYRLKNNTTTFIDLISKSL